MSFEHGQVADLIFFGYVQRSELVHGRTYRSRGGNGSRMVKEIEIVLVAQEGERALAFLSTVTEGKHVTLTSYSRMVGECRKAADELAK